MEQMIKAIQVRVTTLESRVNDMDQRITAANAILPTLQESIRDARRAAEKAAEEIGHLKHWLLMTLAALVVNGGLMVAKELMGK